MKYRIYAPIEKASGWQAFSVRANSPEEALEKFSNGEADFNYEEINVVELGQPEVVEDE